MARCIGECGAEVLIDAYDLESGDDVTERLSGLLASAAELVVLFTPYSRSRVVPIFYGMSKRDLADSGGDGALAGLLERQLNEFDHYLVELKTRIGRDAIL
jgi:hypothetical protein